MKDVVRSSCDDLLPPDFVSVREAHAKEVADLNQRMVKNAEYAVRLHMTLNERDKEIADLQTHNSSLDWLVGEQRTTISDLQQRIAELEKQLSDDPASWEDTRAADLTKEEKP
jgi:septal ring factor EnvC (AmiA/AmiB activator)